MFSGNVKTLFGVAVRTLRSQIGISQEELAHRAGLHRTYVSDIERGARNVSLESIERLARALEISVSALFSRASQEGSEDVEILLVEDNKHDVELTLRAFRKARITNVVHVAADGAQALDFLFARGAHTGRDDMPPPGVILLDLNLPKVAGLDVLRELKADPRTRNIPVVVLTVSDRDRDVAECRRLGAEAYIVKPVGFQNFSEVTPLLQFRWSLIKSAQEQKPGAKQIHGKAR